MMAAEKRNAGWRAGAPEQMQASLQRLPRDDAEVAADLQRRLSGFALAVDAVLPGIAYLEHIVQVAARGDRMPQDAPQRIHKLALQIFDLREVLEVRR